MKNQHTNSQYSPILTICDMGQRLIYTLIVLTISLMPLSVFGSYFDPQSQMYYEFNDNDKTAKVVFGGLYSDEIVNPTVPDSIFFGGYLYKVIEITDGAFGGKALEGHLTIGSNVIRIGKSAFRKCNITSITLGDNISKIDFEAFYGTKLSGIVEIPETVTFIGESAFEACHDIVELIFNANIIDKATNIAIFRDCTSLRKISISGNITHIGKCAFKGCCNLQDVNLSSDIIQIGESSFENCIRLRDIELPESLKYIRTRAFMGCESLRTATMPRYSVENIDESAFQNCVELTNFSFPNSLESIGDYAFSNCAKLANVELGHKLRAIGKYAFENDASIEKLDFRGALSLIDDHAFHGCTGLQSVSFEQSPNIGFSAFYGCSSIASLKIESSSYSGDQYIFDSAFENCTNLKEVELSKYRIWSNAFSGCIRLSHLALRSCDIESEAFTNCTELRNIFFYGGYISKAAFKGCTNLRDVDISAEFKGPDIFLDCPIETVSIGELSGTYFPFKEIKSIKKIAVYGTPIMRKNEFASSASSLRKLVIGTKTSGQSIAPKIGIADSFVADTLQLCADIFYVDEFGYPHSDGSYSIGKFNVIDLEVGHTYSITEIPENAFCGSAIKYIRLPESLKNIGRNAFKDCTKLQKVEMFESGRYPVNIAEDCFYGCPIKFIFVLDSRNQDVHEDEKEMNPLPIFYENSFDADA